MKTEVELIDILTLQPHKIGLLCRICLTEDVVSSSMLLEVNGEKLNILSQKIMMCARVKVDMNDKLPKLICEACCLELNNADQFRIKCETSDSLLRKLFDEFSIKSEDNTVASRRMSAEDCKDDKQILCDVTVGEIKQEAFDFDDSFYDDIEDAEYIPEVPVKKKRKKRSHDEKKQKSKNKKDESNNENIFEIKVESEATTNNGENLNESGNEINDELKTKGKKFICDICTKPLSTKTSLENHIEKMHSEEKKLKMGYVTGYGADRRFHCSECDYKCTRRQALDYHMTTHTGLKPFQCDVCMKCFAQHGALNAHKKIHSDKMYFTCQECGKQFKHKEKYVKHRNNVHQNKDVRHYCNICNKGLKTQKTLTEHMNRHMQIKNYSCEFCGKSVVTRVDLVLHLRVHKRDKMFKCMYCEYSTYSKKTLAIHINRHTKARSFQCEHCEYMCYTRGELKFHTRKHTKEQNYSCPLCDTKFRYSSSVNKHMLRKHGEKYKWNDTVDRRTVK